MSNRRRLRWGPVARSALLFPIGAGAFSLVFVIGGGSDAWHRMQDANGGLVVGFFCMAGAVTLVSTARWRVLIRTLFAASGPPFSILYVQVMISRVIGLFISRAASDLGTRIIALRQSTKASLGRASASVVIDNLMDISVVALFGLPGILFLTDLISAPVATAMMGIIALASLIAAPSAISSAAKWPGVRWSAGVPRRLRLGRFSLGAGVTPEWPDALQRLGRSESAAVWALTLLRFVLGVLQFVILAEAFDLGISPWVFFTIVPLVQVILVTGITPGGLGVVDLGWLGLLVAAGVGTTEASAFVIAQRAGLTLAFLLLAGAAIVTDSLLRRLPAAAAGEQSS